MIYRVQTRNHCLANLTKNDTLSSPSYYDGYILCSKCIIKNYSDFYSIKTVVRGGGVGGCNVRHDQMLITVNISYLCFKENNLRPGKKFYLLSAVNPH